MANLIKQVVGHKEAIERLKKAVERDRLPSSLLFVGPSGVGKKLTAWALAQILVCENSEKEACGTCPSCLRIENRQSENVMCVEPENNQIKIDQSRSVIQFFSSKRLGRSRVVIIDQAHLLNVQAANALLKVLEEPPTNSYFILLSPTLSGILPTVKSRSQVLSFGVLSSEELKQIVDVEDWILEASHGQADLALQLSEQGDSRSEIFNVISKVMSMSAGEAFSYVKDSVKDKAQSLFMARLWQQLFRDAVTEANGLNVCIHRDFLPLIQELAALGEHRLMSLYQGALVLEKNLQTNLDKGLSVEKFLYDVQEVRQS